MIGVQSVDPLLEGSHPAAAEVAVLDLEPSRTSEEVPVGALLPRDLGEHLLGKVAPSASVLPLVLFREKAIKCKVP